MSIVRRFAGLACLQVCASTVTPMTGVASAAVAPLAYWSTARAERAVVAVNPQVFPASSSSRSTLTVSASCTGLGRYRRTERGVRRYHLFLCSLVVAYDGNGGLLVRLPASRWCAYTHQGIDEIVRYGRGWVPGCG